MGNQRGGNVTAYMGAVDYAVHPVTVTNVSQSFEDLIGAALQSDVDQVEIVNQGGAAVYYQCDGTAALATDVPIPNNGDYTCIGGKDHLDDVRLVAAANVNIHLIERITR